MVENHLDIGNAACVERVEMFDADDHHDSDRRGAGMGGLMDVLFAFAETYQSIRVYKE
jgi:hypothetical protein